MRKILNSILITALILPAFIYALPQETEELDFTGWAAGASVYCLTEGNPQFLAAGYLPAGVFSRNRESIKIMENFPEKPFLPWTQQLRVAGFEEAAGDLVVGINMGYPLKFSFLDGDGYGLTSFGPALSEDFLSLSTDRTLGGIFHGEEESVFFHLYRDDLFGRTVQGGEAGHAVIQLNLAEGAPPEIKAVDFDFALENPEWQPVELIKKGNEYLVSWKYSDEKKTLFRYIRHESGGKALQELSEAFFRDGYPLLAAEDGPFAVRGFVRAAREGILGRELAEAGTIYLRLTKSGDGILKDNFPLFYFSEAAASFKKSENLNLPVELPACPSGDDWYVLHGSRVFLCSENIRILNLPPLPGGFVYRNIWAGRDSIIVSWEEVKFPLIGRSGMMHIRLRDIIN